MTGNCKIIIIVCLAVLISITPAISSEKKNEEKAGDVMNKSISGTSVTERYFDNCRKKFKKLDKNSDGYLTSADYELSRFKIALLMSTPPIPEGYRGADSRKPKKSSKICHYGHKQRWAGEF